MILTIFNEIYIGTDFILSGQNSQTHSFPNEGSLAFDTLTGSNLSKYFRFELEKGDVSL